MASQEPAGSGEAVAPDHLAGKSPFYAKLHAFQRERGEDTGAPTFAKRAVDQYRLWVAVHEAGGHAEVTGSKGWARIGRMFDPPRTMTDLSFRIKKLYETNLLPFEKAVAAGEITGVYVPPRAAPPPPAPATMDKPLKDKPPKDKPPKDKPARAPRPKRSAAASAPQTSAAGAAPASGSGTPAPAPEPRPKRARRAKRDELVGQRIRVLWPDEQQFFSGTVAAFNAETGTHRVEYDDGDEEMLDLAEQTWHLLPGLPPGAERGLDGAGLGALHSAAEALQAGQGASAATGCVASGDGYKVFQTAEPPGFEAFCMTPGLGVQDIRVQCWDSGRLLVCGKPPAGGALEAWGGAAQLQHRIRLPAPVHARSARALLTLHGQLYIRVLCQPAAEPGLAPEAARAAADALLGQAGPPHQQPVPQQAQQQQAQQQQAQQQQQQQLGGEQAQQGQGVPQPPSPQLEGEEQPSQQQQQQAQAAGAPEQLGQAPAAAVAAGELAPKAEGAGPQPMDVEGAAGGGSAAAALKGLAEQPAAAAEAQSVAEVQPAAAAEAQPAAAPTAQPAAAAPAADVMAALVSAAAAVAE